VGITVFGAPDTGLFTKAWDILLRAQDTVTWKNDNVGYGLEFYTDEFNSEKKWFYMAAMEMDNLNDIPITMTGKVIPPHTYCVFNCKGGVEELGKVFRFAYDKWIPDSKYQVAGWFDFEYYDERFKGDKNPETGIDVYIPVKEK
jgi:AraC family transcriptional regulator